MVAEEGVRQSPWRRVVQWGGLLIGAAAVAALIATHTGSLSAFVPWAVGSNNVVVGTPTFIASRGFASQAALNEHFERDGADFNAGSAAAYDSLARQFFQNRRLWQRSDFAGTIRLYDPHTNTFGSYSSGGTTISYFKPEAGTAYWARLTSQTR